MSGSRCLFLLKNQMFQSNRTLQEWNTIKLNKIIRIFHTKVKLRYLLFKLPR